MNLEEHKKIRDGDVYLLKEFAFQINLITWALRFKALCPKIGGDYIHIMGNKLI